MGRALMTPDELRRMDNDVCIIYEKGIKPIKANKYYYFKYPEGRLVNRYKTDHNNVQVERGLWRIYNPYNPYVEESDKANGGGAANSLESLDDLFEDDLNETVSASSDKVETTTKPDTKPAMKIQNDLPKIEEDDEKRQAELLDIQKELEAKFDELFGSIDD